MTSIDRNFSFPVDEVNGCGVNPLGSGPVSQYGPETENPMVDKNVESEVIRGLLIVAQVIIG